jgi:hypothetical protein
MQGGEKCIWREKMYLQRRKELDEGQYYILVLYFSPTALLT